MNISRIAPEFIEPSTIKNLSEEDQVKLLEDIRQRRLVAVIGYQKVLEEKKKVKEEVYQKKYDRLANKVARSIEKIDVELEKIKGEFGKLRVLRLEAFDVDP